MTKKPETLKHQRCVFTTVNLLTDRAERSTSGFMKLLETSIFRLHLIDSNINCTTSTVDHHVSRTYHTFHRQNFRIHFISKQIKNVDVLHSKMQTHNLWCLIFGFRQ